MRPRPALAAALLLSFTVGVAPGMAANAAPWAEVRIPALGETRSHHGAEIAPATLDVARVAELAAMIERAPDTAAFLHAIAVLRENSFIPPETLAPLQRLLRRDQATPDFGQRARHRLRFQDGAQLSVEIDWPRRIIVDATPSAPLPVADRMSAPQASLTTLPEALALFRNHLVLAGLEPARLKLSATRYGTRSILLRAEALEPLLSPAPPAERYALDTALARSPIQRFDANRLAALVDGELRPTTRAQRIAAAKAFVTLANPDARLITAAADIPGHAQRPLDADLKGTIRAPFHFPGPHESSSEVLVCYSYTPLGGIVTRYRFEFSADGLSQATPTVLATDVGAAHYHH